MYLYLKETVASSSPGFFVVMIFSEVLKTTNNFLLGCENFLIKDNTDFLKCNLKFSCYCVFIFISSSDSSLLLHLKFHFLLFPLCGQNFCFCCHKENKKFFIGTSVLQSVSFSQKYDMIAFQGASLVMLCQFTYMKSCVYICLVEVFFSCRAVKAVLSTRIRLLVEAPQSPSLASTNFYIFCFPFDPKGMIIILIYPLQSQNQ